MASREPAALKAEARRVLRFLAVGLLNTSFGYAAYAAFVLTGAPLWLAVAGATTLALLFNFMSYGGLVFGSTKLWLLPRFLLFYGLLGLLNFGLLQALAELGLGPLLSQALILPILAVFGYAGMRLAVFRGQGAMPAAKVGP